MGNIERFVTDLPAVDFKILLQFLAKIDSGDADFLNISNTILNILRGIKREDIPLQYLINYIAKLQDKTDQIDALNNLSKEYNNLIKILSENNFYTKDTSLLDGYDISVHMGINEFSSYKDVSNIKNEIRRSLSVDSKDIIDLITTLAIPENDGVSSKDNIEIIINEFVNIYENNIVRRAHMYTSRRIVIYSFFANYDDLPDDVANAVLAFTTDTETKPTFSNTFKYKDCREVFMTVMKKLKKCLIFY